MAMEMQGWAMLTIIPLPSPGRPFSFSFFFWVCWGWSPLTEHCAKCPSTTWHIHSTPIITWKAYSATFTPNDTETVPAWIMGIRRTVRTRTAKVLQLEKHTKPNITHNTSLTSRQLSVFLSHSNNGFSNLQVVCPFVKREKSVKMGVGSSENYIHIQPCSLCISPCFHDIRVKRVGYSTP